MEFLCPDKAKEKIKNEGITVTYEVLETNCILAYRVDKELEISQELDRFPNDWSVKRCREVEKAYNGSGARILATLVEGCEAYYQPVSDQIEFIPQAYKNPHCFHCIHYEESEKREKKLHCVSDQFGNVGLISYPFTPDFRVLMAASGAMTVQNIKSNYEEKEEKEHGDSDVNSAPYSRMNHAGNTLALIVHAICLYLINMYG